MDLLGPDIFSTLCMKEQVFHRERAHLKVPDRSLVLKWTPTYFIETWQKHRQLFSQGFISNQLIYVFNSVVNTKFPAILSHRCSTTVSLETYLFIHLLTYIADMAFPGEMIVNKNPKEFSYIRLSWEFTPKGERNALVRFILSGFKNDVVFFKPTESLLHFSQTSIFWSSSLSTDSKQFRFELE